MKSAAEQPLAHRRRLLRCFKNCCQGGSADGSNPWDFAANQAFAAKEKGGLWQKVFEICHARICRLSCFFRRRGCSKQLFMPPKVHLLKLTALLLGLGCSLATVPAAAAVDGVAGRVMLSNLEDYPEIAIGDVFGKYVNCHDPRWDVAEDQQTVTFTCSIPFRFMEKLPPEILRELHGPAFNHTLKAVFPVPEAPGKLNPLSLSIGYGDSFPLMPEDKIKMALKTLVSGEDIIYKLSSLINSNACTELRKLIYQYFTSPKVPAADFKRSFYFDDKIQYIKSIDNISWTALKQPGSFAAIVGITLVETSLRDTDVFEYLKSQGTAWAPDILELVAADAKELKGLPCTRTEYKYRYYCDAGNFFENWVNTINKDPENPSLSRMTCSPRKNAPAPEQIRFFLEWNKLNPLPVLKLHNEQKIEYKK